MPDYSERVLAHFGSPRNVGMLDNPTAVGVCGEPGKGNYMVLHLAILGDCVVDCRFLTFGCPPAIAAGSVLTEMVKGSTIRDAMAITAEQVEGALGGLPLGRRHCAALAVSALRDGLRAFIVDGEP